MRAPPERWWSGGPTKNALGRRRCQVVSSAPGLATRMFCQKRGQGAGESLGLLEVREMGSRRENHQLAALDALVHDLRGGDRSALVILADDDEGRDRDRRDAVGEIERGDRVT